MSRSASRAKGRSRSVVAHARRYGPARPMRLLFQPVGNRLSGTFGVAETPDQLCEGKCHVTQRRQSRSSGSVAEAAELQPKRTVGSDGQRYGWRPGGGDKTPL